MIKPEQKISAGVRKKIDVSFLLTTGENLDLSFGGYFYVWDSWLIITAGLSRIILDTTYVFELILFVVSFYNPFHLT